MTTGELSRPDRSADQGGEVYRLRALGIIRVRDGEIVHYRDHMDPVTTARLLGRTADLAAALTGGVAPSG